jgi:hypothetical protein
MSRGLLWALVLFTGLFMAGCDAVYYVRLSVPLPPEEAEDSVAALKSRLEEELGVSCQSTAYALLDKSLESALWQLQECDSTAEYAQLLIARSPRDLVVEIHQIGGSREPEAFRRYRIAAHEAMSQLIPSAPIAVDSRRSLPERSFKFDDQTPMVGRPTTRSS